MNTPKMHCLLPILLILMFSLGFNIAAAQVETETVYYGIEINGVLCGYSEITKSPMVKDGKDMILLKQKAFLMLSALGSQFNTEVELTYHVDPSTGKFTYHDCDITQGPTKLSSVIFIEGDTARFTSTLSEEIITELPQDVILENMLFFPHLLKDFVEEGLEEKTYEIYEVREAEVQKTTYTKIGTEELEFAGKTYNAILLNELNQETGLKVKWWLNTENGYLLKAVLPNNRMSYLTDPSVVKKIKMANLDENLASKVNVSIADFQAISYMKVKAEIEPTGLWVTTEGLNVRDQSFTGTVNENLIEGVFEIQHMPYDGSDAPDFPPDFSKVDSLKEYIEPDDMIDSDDPVLVKKAREITEGSKDSWEAARRLSRWVADSIIYAIPGQVSARKTYDARSGECGAHSLLLAAFCRAVGIPARVVWGCMYTPNFGGCFGQHGWNEIYMGKAGWIPVDATAFETDYVDCGHIRIGTYQSMVTALNPKEMEVLDYKVGSMKMGEVEEPLPEKYETYVGEYINIGNNMLLKVFVQGGNLTVDIPEKVVLALNDPDEEGLWYCKLTDKLYFTFKKDSSGKVLEMELHELISMPKRKEPEEIDNDVPEEFKPYLGKYFLAALQAEFKVIYKGGCLAVDDPIEKVTVKLQPPDKKGRWRDEFNKNEIFFEFDAEGAAKTLIIDSINRFKKKES